MLKQVVRVSLGCLALSAMAYGVTPTTLTLATSQSPSVYGQAVSITAAVTPATATGSVTFYSGVTVLETEPVVNGQAAYTTVLLPFGSLTLRARYLGNSTYAPSASAVVHQVVNTLPGAGFGTPLVYNSVSSPKALAVADFNGDGKPDLASLTAVWLGNGDGTFQPPDTFTAITTPESLAVGDFNGDGIPDLAIGNSIAYGANSIYVLLGNGDGTFQTPSSTALNLFPASLLVGDFNQDGNADIAFVAFGSGNPEGSLGVMLGNGDGTFQPPAYYGSANYFCCMLDADFNADGKTDIVIPVSGSGTPTTLAIFLGNTGGTFGTPLAYSSGPVSAIAVKDVNGDGKPDLIYSTTPATTAEIAIALGNGNGTFQPPLFLPAGTLTSGPVAIADFNGDGKADILTGSASSGLFSILLGNGDGTFQAPIPYTGAGAAIAVSDFNGDGRADVLVGSSVLLATSSADTVTLSSSLNPSFYQQIVIITATVSDSAAAGTMQFFDGTTSLGANTVNAGVAIFETTALAAGSHPLSAVYSGDPNHSPTTSNTLTQVVNLPSDSTSLTSSANPATYLQPVTLTATVSPASATGSITFLHGSTSFGTVPLTNGTCSLMIPSLSVGAHSLTAMYSGDANDAPSTSPALNEVIVKATTQTTLTSSPNPSALGAPVTLTAGVVPVSATGTVTFFHGTTSLGTATVTNGKAQFTTSTLTSGSHSLTATYGGDANDAASTSTAITQVVQ